VLKSFARQAWRQHCHATGGAETDRMMIADNLIESWNRISAAVIDSARDIYWTQEGGNEDNLNDGTFRPMIILDDLFDDLLDED
jgi:hypothetical protein